MRKRIETHRHRTIAYCLFPTPTIMTFTANAALREQQALPSLIYQTLSVSLGINS